MNKNHYIKKAKEFFELGKKEYEDGIKNGEIIKIRQGCKKIWNALVELSDGIITENGYPIPEDHATRAEILQKFGMHRLYDWTKESLHNRCYYSGIIKEKLLEDAIASIEYEIKKRS
ncbi:MAG: hypothetical protein ACE5J3_13765 [Methanosarcinales archaeon]